MFFTLQDYLTVIYDKILFNLQEPHQECIGEDKLLFAKGEFNMNKLFVLTTML